jgi:hypothetical protein
MGKVGTLSGMIESAIATGMVNVSLADVEVKLKDVEKATDATSKRWQEMMSSSHATAYKAKRSMDDAQQTQLIIDLENLLGLVASICLAQQRVLVTMQGALKHLNKK